MEKDRVFAEPKRSIGPFEFNREVARVFDDMLNRSVPLYAESVQRQSQLAAGFYQEGSLIYDLGCSHGNLGLKVMECMGNRKFSMIGVDSSIPMIERYQNRLKERGPSHSVNLVCGFVEDLRFKNASVVLINLTLQFLKPGCRDRLIRSIYEGMNPGGILLLTEKIVHPADEINVLQTEFYKTYKLENGYSELEISQKRDALEKVLIPDSLDVHQKRVLGSGFALFDVWLKWFNFASMIAIKK